MKTHTNGRIPMSEVIRTMRSRGYLMSEIAEYLGVSNQRVHQAYRGQVRFCKECRHWHRRTLGHYPNKRGLRCGD